MKTITWTISIALILLTVSCKKDDPIAAFETDEDTYAVKQSILFTNNSENASSFYWNFGDGSFSNLRNPGHTYTEAGEYIVTLQVTGSKRKEPIEVNKKITILAENENGLLADVIFANTSWVGDSLSEFIKSCYGEVYDYTENISNESMVFNDNNTVLMLHNSYGNICDYEILNDSTIAFYETPYYRIWTFSIDDNKLMLTQRNTTPCSGEYPEENYVTIIQKHFVKKE